MRRHRASGPLSRRAASSFPWRLERRLAPTNAISGRARPVVRAMPNTPAAVGRGASVLVVNRNVRTDQRELAERMMAAVGTADWVEDEELMHVVTAMSGGGPAYVFLLIEAL